MTDSESEPKRLDSKGIRREPLQQRSQASLDRLLDVTEELLRERRFESILVADIVRRAKSSVGVFYSRFQDKADVLFALVDRENSKSTDTVDQFVASIDQLDDIPLDRILQRGIEILVNQYRARRHVLAPIIGLNLSQPDRYAFHNPVKERLQQVAQHLASLRGNEVDHPDPASAVRVVLGLITGFLEHLVIFDKAGYCGLRLDDPRVEEEMYLVAKRYLGLKEMSSG
ncbi:TetR/AcrR family transcriptional regulator [bacterium]|nr:TetR/AcrR family transcriptional regulator [bacterium]